MRLLDWLRSKAYGILVFGNLLLISSPAMAAPSSSYLPSQWSQPMNIGGNAIVRAMIELARFVLPILGAWVMIKALLELIKAVGKGLAGEKVETGNIIGGRQIGSTVLTKIVEVIVGLVLLAVPLTGMWVPLVNALLALGQSLLQTVSNAIAGVAR